MLTSIQPCPRMPSIQMKTSKDKPKSFDAVAASRRWRVRSSRELAGLTYTSRCRRV